MKPKFHIKTIFYYLENLNMKIYDVLFFSSSVNENKKIYRKFLNVLLGGPIVCKNYEP